MQSASLFLSAISVPLIDTAIGSLKSARLTSSIICPGVKPCSIRRLLDGCEISISEIMPRSLNFNSAAVRIFCSLPKLLRLNPHKDSHGRFDCQYLLWVKVKSPLNELQIVICYMIKTFDIGIKLELL